MLKTGTCQIGLSGLFCALCTSSLSPSASAQILNESAKLLASDGVAFDEFGAWVTVDGDVAVVGAPQGSAVPQKPGSAYVFRWNGTSWIEEQKLLASDGAPKDEFGAWVAIDGDVIVVAASLDDDNGTDAGSVYVFRYDASESVCGQKWCEEQELWAADGSPFDQFGAVAVSGDVILVGAFKQEVGIEFGSAYVFRFDPTQSICGQKWCQEQKLLAFDGELSDRFGWSVAVSGDVAFVGSIGAEGVVNGSGAVYVYRWDGAVWNLEQKLFASDGIDGQYFGSSLSVSGDRVLVGAWLDDDNGFQSGSAYVFRLDPTETVCGQKWCAEQKLLASDGAEGDLFGFFVSLSNDLALVGAVWDDDNGNTSGSAYAFRWNGSGWIEQHKLLASDGAFSDTFGRVAISGEAVIVGAAFDDDNGADSGSVYVFSATPPSIPAVSHWGLVAMTLMVLTAGTLVYTRRLSAQP